jgi:predicted RecB family nuclease
MKLPDGFVFSQRSLQDYQDCARRFQLRYLEHCLWPAPQTADALEFEHDLRLGDAFHRLMSQLHSGVPTQALQEGVNADPELARWWASYLSTPPQGLPEGLRETELTLSTALAGRRLEARYDLLAGAPGGRWTIVDWKTNRRRTPRSTLSQRLQTRIYPFVLVQAGAALNGGAPIAADQVDMLYWFAEFPAQPERFAYDGTAQSADAHFLEELLREIQVLPEDGFAKTDDRRRCGYCVYRSLCWEDVLAGALAELEEPAEGEAALEGLDLETVEPIPF